MRNFDVLVKELKGSLEDGFSFRWNGFTYTYDKKTRIFRDDDGDTLFANKFLTYDKCFTRFLNDEVEVL